MRGALVRRGRPERRRSDLVVEVGGGAGDVALGLGVEMAAASGGEVVGGEAGEGETGWG